MDYWLAPKSNGKCPNKKQKRRETEREGHIKDRGRDWSVAATSPGMPVATRSWKRPGTESPLNPLEGAWPCGYLDIGLLASRTVKGDISVVFRHPVHGDSLQQPQETTIAPKEVTCPLFVTMSWKDAAGRACSHPQLCQSPPVPFLCNSIQHLCLGVHHPIYWEGGGGGVRWSGDPRSITWAQAWGKRRPVTLGMNADRL